MKYKWKDKAQSPVKAQIVGTILNGLVENNDGVLLPSTIVRYAKPKKSPLHICFEWDDKKAASKYRETQASYLIRSLVLIEDENENEVFVRAFVSVQDEESNDRYYTTVQRAVIDPETYDQVLQQAYDDYTALRTKYKHLKEFQKVNEEIDKVKVG